MIVPHPVMSVLFVSPFVENRLKEKPREEPQGCIIETDQPFKVEFTFAVVPRAHPKTPKQCAGAEFGEEYPGSVNASPYQTRKTL